MNKISVPNRPMPTPDIDDLIYGSAAPRPSER